VLPPALIMTCCGNAGDEYVGMAIMEGADGKVMGATVVEAMAGRATVGAGIIVDAVMGLMVDAEKGTAAAPT